MLRIPGPMCGSILGDDWIDPGTMARSRMVSRVEQLDKSPTVAFAPQYLKPQERDLLTVLDDAGITNVTERAMFLAQVAHESKDFRKLRENMNYSAARLLAVFPKRFKSLKDAEEVVKQGFDAIAERIYGGRKDLGNVEKGDGARYIGRGYIHLTGRSNYMNAGQALGLDLVHHPELAENPNTAARIAVWFWQRDPRLGSRARARSVSGVTRIVNGGLNGLADRKRRFKQYLEILDTDNSDETAGSSSPLP